MTPLQRRYDTFLRWWPLWVPGVSLVALGGLVFVTGGFQ